MGFQPAIKGVLMECIVQFRRRVMDMFTVPKSLVIRTEEGINLLLRLQIFIW